MKKVEEVSPIVQIQCYQDWTREERKRFPRRKIVVQGKKLHNVGTEHER